MQPTHLDLFSGIGGFALAAKWAGFRTIGFCEIDKYCQKVLAKNFLANASIKQTSWQGSGGFQSESPQCYPDIRDINGLCFRGVDLITGGFPCQPFSCAGKRRGKEDDRHLWPEMCRVIKEARPAWVLGENVTGIIGMELDSVLSDLEAQGYSTRPFVIPACGVDARHRRNRAWIIANTQHNGLHETESRLGTQWTTGGSNELLKSEGQDCISGGSTATNWLPEPDVGRVAHGVPSRVDRLKGLGNAIVPQVAYQILKEIRKLI